MKDYLLENGFGYTMDDTTLVRSVIVSKNEYLQAHEEELDYDLKFTNDRLWLESIGY